MDFTNLSRRTGLTPGVLHMLAATAWFAMMNVTVKKLGHLPAMELVFFRCGVATILGFFGLLKLKVNWKGSNRRLLFLRGLFGTAGLYTFFLTMQHMPLGTAVTIQYLSPIFSAIAAYFLLKERIQPIQWVFFLMAFMGVLLIKGFNSAISWKLLCIGILSAMFSALAYNMVRSLKDKEHPLVVVLHFQFLGVVIGGAFTIFFWVSPMGYDWIYILLTGIFTQLGQVNLTKSLQRESIGRVSILNYLGIFYALLLGWLFFDETAGPIFLIGVALVAGGVILNLIFTSPQSSDKSVLPTSKSM